MNNYVLYLHTSPSGKRYYGITKQNPKKRWQNGKGYIDNPYFWRAIQKYGWDNFTHEILQEGLTKHEAGELEKYMIQWYDTTNRQYGYNLSLGGESGNHSEESKQKMSEARKSENNPMYNKHHTEEAKQKMSEANKGKNNYKAKSVICITTKKIFFATREAARYYNMKTQAHIIQCCQGKRKSAGKHNNQKLVWRYLNHNHNKTYRLAKNN